MEPSADALEVVRYSPIEALDRALMKEKQKQKQLKGVPLPDGQEDEDLEVLGLEMMLVEESIDSPKDSPAKASQKTGMFGRFRSNKVLRKKSKRSSAKVVLLSQKRDSAERRKQAAEKADNARRLLDQALSASADDTQVDQLLRTAFSEAAEARRLVEADATTLELELKQTMSLGENEAREANRMRSEVVALGHDDEVGEEEKKEEEKKAKQAGRSSMAQLMSPGEMIKAASDHAEAARRYLESILPDFLNDTVSEDDEEGGQNAPKALMKENDERRRAAEEKREEIKRRREEEQREAIARVVQQNNTISTLTFQDRDEETLTINSLNEFLDGPLSPETKSKSTPKNAEPRIVSSVPSYQHEQVRKALKEKAGAKDTKTKSSYGLFRRSREKELGKTGEAVITSAGAVAAVNKSKKKEKLSSRKVDRFVATVLPPEDEIPVAAEDVESLASAREIDRNTGSRLETAIQDEDGASVTSWDGVPLHGGYAPPAQKKKMKAATVTQPIQRTKPRDHTKIQPQFIKAPKIDARIMTRESWDSLAAGDTSLDEVVSLADVGATDPNSSSKGSRSKSKRFFVFGRRAKEDRSPVTNITTGNIIEPSPMVSNAAGADSCEDSTHQGQDEDTAKPTNDANNISALSDDSLVNMDGDADKYTDMYDEEDEVSKQAKERLESEKPIAVDVDIMPEKPQTGSFLRQVFSWDARRAKNNVVEPSFVEVDDDGDETRVVLANKDEVVESLQVPKGTSYSSGIVNVERTKSDADQMKLSRTFMEEMEAAKEISCQNRGLLSTEEQEAKEKIGRRRHFWKKKA